MPGKDFINLAVPDVFAKPKNVYITLVKDRKEPMSAAGHLLSNVETLNGHLYGNPTPEHHAASSPLRNIVVTTIMPDRSKYFVIPLSSMKALNNDNIGLITVSIHDPFVTHADVHLGIYHGNGAERPKSIFVSTEVVKLLQKTSAPMVFSGIPTIDSGEDDTVSDDEVALQQYFITVPIIVDDRLEREPLPLSYTLTVSNLVELEDYTCTLSGLGDESEMPCKEFMNPGVSVKKTIAAKGLGFIYSELDQPENSERRFLWSFTYAMECSKRVPEMFMHWRQELGSRYWRISGYIVYIVQRKTGHVLYGSMGSSLQDRPIFGRYWQMLKTNRAYAVVMEVTASADVVQMFTLRKSGTRNDTDRHLGQFSTKWSLVMEEEHVRIVAIGNENGIVYMDRRAYAGDLSDIVIPLNLAYKLYSQKARIRKIKIDERINAIICDETFDNWEMYVQTELNRSPFTIPSPQDILGLSGLKLSAYSSVPFHYEVVAYSTKTSELIWSSRLQAHGQLLKDLVDTKTCPISIPSEICYLATRRLAKIRLVAASQAGDIYLNISLKKWHHFWELDPEYIPLDMPQASYKKFKPFVSEWGPILLRVKAGTYLKVPKIDETEMNKDMRVIWTSPFSTLETLIIPDEIIKLAGVGKAEIWIESRDAQTGELIRSNIPFPYEQAQLCSLFFARQTWARLHLHKETEYNLAMEDVKRRRIFEERKEAITRTISGLEEPQRKGRRQIARAARPNIKDEHVDSIIGEVGRIKSTANAIAAAQLRLEPEEYQTAMDLVEYQKKVEESMILEEDDKNPYTMADLHDRDTGRPIDMLAAERLYNDYMDDSDDEFVAYTGTIDESESESSAASPAPSSTKSSVGSPANVDEISGLSNEETGLSTESTLDQQDNAKRPTGKGNLQSIINTEVLDPIQNTPKANARILRPRKPASSVHLAQKAPKARGRKSTPAKRATKPTSSTAQGEASASNAPVNSAPLSELPSQPGSTSESPVIAGQSNASQVLSSQMMAAPQRRLTRLSMSQQPPASYHAGRAENGIERIRSPQKRSAPGPKARKK